MNIYGSIVWSAAFSGNKFATFGEDSAKKLYMAAVNNGKIFRVTTTTLASDDHILNSFKIYPNPATHKIFINGLKTKNNTAEFNNVEGRKVLERKVNDDQSIDISPLKPGVYFVTVSSEGLRIYSQKVIIK